MSTSSSVSEAVAKGGRLSMPQPHRGRPSIGIHLACHKKPDVMPMLCQYSTRSVRCRRPDRRQRQETERQPRTDPGTGALHLHQCFPQLLGRQEPVVLPLLPAGRQHRRQSAGRVVRPIAGRYAPRHDAADSLPQPLPGRPLTPPQRHQDPHQVGGLDLIHRQVFETREGMAFQQPSDVTGGGRLPSLETGSPGTASRLP